MIYDNGVDRTNFDSSGLSTGYDESLLMNDCESVILRLIKSQFQGVANQRVSTLGENWQSEMIGNMQGLQNRFVDAFRSRQGEIMSLMKKSITNGFSVGVQSSKTELTRSGIEHPKQDFTLNDAKEGKDTLLTAFSNILEAQSIAITTVMIDYGSMLMVMGSNPNAYVGDIYDRVFVPTIKDGLVGKITKNGSKLNLTSYVEGLTRETSQQALLMGESTVANAAGQYLVRISSHQSSCPKCAPWQGKVLIDDVYADGQADGKYELLSVAIASGLFHWNCRHKKTIWIPGKSRSYEEKIDKSKVAKNYELEQTQRSLEREIRKQKRIAETSLDPNQANRARDRQAELQARLNALIKEGRAKGYDIYRQSHKEAAGFEYEKKLPYGISDNSLDNGAASQYNNDKYREKQFDIQLFAEQKDTKKVSNLVARNWYVDHVRNIKNEIDQSLSIEEKARIAFQMRNNIRTQARDIMEDVESRKRLDWEHPNSSFEELVASKMFRKNMTREQAIQDVYETATKTNKNIDKIFGIE